MSAPSEGETETKEIIADVLRGFLLLENAALTGSEQVFVFGVARKSCTYSHTANAFRETWGNDERLRSHDISPCRNSLKGGHVAGDVHWTGEENERQETDYDYEDSLDPWTSEWYDIEGHDDESYSEEPDWTKNFYETDEYDANDSTFSEHIPALLDQPVETQEGDASNLETVQEAVAAANAAADMSRRTWTQARQPMKDVHRSRGYFPVSKRQSNGGGSWHRQVTRQEGTLQQRKRKTQGKEQRKRQGEASRPMSSVSGTSLGS